MAYYNEDQLKRYFEKAIQRESDKQVEKLRKEINAIYSREIKKVKEDLAIKKQVQLSKAIRDVQVDYQDKINKIGVGYDEKLIKKRTEMTDYVFNHVEKKLVDFVQKPEYEELMALKIKEMKSSIKDKKVSFQIGLEDQKLEKLIQKEYGVKSAIERTEDIRLGGFQALLIDDEVEIDETIDSKFNERKEWFYMNSKLFIRH